jgi:(p)ppGpp synthase/HD superfamily hydrolase
MNQGELMKVDNPNDLVRLARAVDFAARHHTDQRRKGERAEPYFNHLADVARLLAEATDGADANLVLAGYLHDTIEDQGVKHHELVEAFGDDVADLVLHVTDDKTLPKERRKELQVEHAPHLPPRARMLKLADKSSNLAAILASPPPWSVERRQDYFELARRVVHGCRGTNASLEERFDALYARRGELNGSAKPL